MKERVTELINKLNGGLCESDFKEYEKILEDYIASGINISDESLHYSMIDLINLMKELR